MRGRCPHRPRGWFWPPATRSKARHRQRRRGRRGPSVVTPDRLHRLEHQCLTDPGDLRFEGPGNPPPPSSSRRPDHRARHGGERDTAQHAADQQHRGPGHPAKVGHWRLGQGQGEEQIAHDQPGQADCGRADQQQLERPDQPPPQRSLVEAELGPGHRDVQRVGDVGPARAGRGQDGLRPGSANLPRTGRRPLAEPDSRRRSRPGRPGRCWSPAPDQRHPQPEFPYQPGPAGGGGAGRRAGAAPTGSPASRCGAPRGGCRHPGRPGRPAARRRRPPTTPTARPPVSRPTGATPVATISPLSSATTVVTSADSRCRAARRAPTACCR